MLCFDVLIIAKCFVQLRRDVIFDFTFSPGLYCLSSQVNLCEINVNGFGEKIPLGSQSVGPKGES